MSKDRVNLSVDREALERGRRYGQRHGVSLSRLVSDYLRTLPDPTASPGDLTPAVRRLLGSALSPDPGSGSGAVAAAGGIDREDYLVTRDAKGYRGVDLPVLSPGAAL